MDAMQLRALMAHPLFFGVFTDEIELAAEAARGGYLAARFSPGERITHPTERWMALVLNGHAKVYSTDTVRQVLLRPIAAGDLVGVAQMFAASAPPMSRMIADSEMTLLVLEAQAVRRLLDTSTRFRDNCLAFLADRVAFLNRKITTVTAGSAERRLALTLDGMAGEADTFSLTTSLSALADALDISRASLYRALDTLEADGFLIRDGRQFTLCARLAMLARYH